ncbi:uncharacterized protein LOC110689486 [Chenopodium quinoa]|uniref:uncharacterized protein LOC110689486 n=1 Tax=Chenopodium quinoa TaxID=63459 RepID=UPI000B781FF0|nr:uncharacterized protein LOC110689486 [Chenopodium quinoa]
MADDLVSRYANLNLEDEENGVVDLGATDALPMNDKFNLLLIGKVMIDRPYNVDAFKATITKVWVLTNEIVIRVLGPNLYAFLLFHWRDKEKVLSGRPWCFDNMLIVIKEVEGDEQPERIALCHSPFWVRIKFLPFNCRSDTDVKEIAWNLGEVLEIEEDKLRLDRFRRVKVMSNVNKPLRRCQKIRDKAGKEIILLWNLPMRD